MMINAKEKIKQVKETGVSWGRVWVHGDVGVGVGWVVMINFEFSKSYFTVKVIFE